MTSMALCVPVDAQQPPQSQIIALNAGWNLISLQVGGGTTPVAFKSSMLQPERLMEVWGYQPGGSPATPGVWQTYQPLKPEFPSDLTSLQPGHGYWVKVSQSTSVTFRDVPWDGGVALLPGWNLVGFPGVGLAANEVQDFSSVFGSSLASIPQVWTHENDTKRFVGYDLTAIPALRDLNQIKPGMGYWMYALQSVLITPQPYVALPGDSDASPLEAPVDFVASQFPGLSNASEYLGSQIRKVRPGSEDAAYDLNGNGIIDGPFTQNTLLFEVGVNQKVITIGNTGGGLATWSVQNMLSWLTTTPNPAAGVVSADRDTVSLLVDRTGMAPGRQTGQFTIYVGGRAKVTTVLVDVPTAAGDWKGLATTQRVNGKNIPIGAVDMGLNFFMASPLPTETTFTGVLNQDTSLLFPRDVFMNGVFYSGDNFSLTTNFQMDAGDRNAPPYDTFSHVAPNTSGGATLNSLTARDDKDYNGDHKLDVQNPFPFAIHRQITLLGQRKNPNHMEGTYIESVTGMLPQNQPIFIEGTFFLDRQSLMPTKKSIFNGTTTNAPITIGGTSGILFRETTFTVTNPVTISGITVNLNLSFPDPSKLLVYLMGPNNQIVNLSQYSSALGTSYTLSDYNGLSGAGTWKLHVEWLSTSLRGTFTNWTLNVQGLATYSAIGKVIGNPGSGNQALAGVHAILTGSNVLQQVDTAPFVLATSTISGSLKASLASTSSLYAGMPISGNPAIPGGATVTSVNNSTTVTLSAAATATGSASTTYGTPGMFKFSGLTENQYTVTLTKPGFTSRSIAFYLNNASYYLGDGAGQGTASTDSNILANDPVVLPAVPAGSPRLDASPFLGAEPLNVNFSLIVSNSQLTTLGSNLTATWNFGDDTPPITDTADLNDDLTLSTAKHIYLTAGDYTPTLTLTGDSGSLPVLSNAIHVQRVTPDIRSGAPIAQLIGVGFIGSFAAPLSNANVIEQAPGAPVVYQESKRDSASFDIDRTDAIPLPEPGTPASTTFNYFKEDSDFSNQLYVFYNGAFPTTTYNQANWHTRAFDPTIDPSTDNSPNTFTTYQPAQPNVPADRFRIFCTLGGFVFGEQPSLVGDYLLQPGRIEP